MPNRSPLFDPSPFLSLIRSADRLESLPRTGYLISRVPLPESVAAHTFGVAMVAMLLADAISDRLAATDDSTDKPTLELVLRMALLHDIQESITTDIPSPVKRKLGPEIFEAAERAAATDLLSPFGRRYMDVWEDYEAKESLESRIVHAADKIQMLVKVLQYQSAGLGDTRRFWQKPVNFNDYGLPEARVILDALVEHNRAGDWPVEDVE